MRSTLWGLAAGSLALIAVYVAVQPGASGRLAAGGNVLVVGLRRLLSPEVAGIPVRGGRPWAPAAAGQGAGGTARGPSIVDRADPQRRD